MKDAVDDKIKGFIYPNWPAPENVKAVMTTRCGGVSQPPFDGMNLGAHVDDRMADVSHNRALLKNTLALPDEPLWLNQIHSTRVAQYSQTKAGDDADAVVSRQPHQVCSIMTADCLPVLFCNTQGDTIAAAHAGWRGLQGGILESCVTEMACNTGDIIVWLGAAIGVESFEVGAEVREAFLAAYDESESAFVGNKQCEGKWFADIYQLARIHLTNAGVAAENIYGGGHCTFTESSLFFSYRREARTGRMASLIWCT